MAPHYPKSLGFVKLHPFTHGGILWLTIAFSQLLISHLPRIEQVPPLYSQGTVWGLGLIAYWTIVQTRQSLQRLLGSLNIRLLEIGTIALWIFIIQQVGQFLPRVLGGLRIPFPEFPPAWIPWSVGFFVLSFVGFPWLINPILRWGWNLQPLTLKTLEGKSPQAAKLLRSVFHSQGLTLPPLSLIPSPVPLCFSYGWLSGSCHILMSEGLIDRLSPEEIAALYALEIAHLKQRSSWVLPWLVFWTHIPYLLYWYAALGGDRLIPWGQRLRTAKAQPQRILSWAVAAMAYTLGIVAAAAYGVFKGLRFLLLPLARLRCYYSDRLAVPLTQNVNAQTQVLLTLSQAQAADLESRGCIHPWLESLELLSPIGYTTGISLSSALQHFPPDQALEWDSQNPQRHWLSLNSPHPPTGDRIFQLQQLAQRNGISTSETLPSQPGLALLPHYDGSLVQGRSWWRLLCQALPYLGGFLGLGVGLSIWFFSALANLWGIRSFTWMLGNVDIIRYSIPLGIVLGVILRHNLFFPSLPRRLDRAETALPQILSQGDTLPLNAIAFQNNGILLGRSGLSNWLGQDLWLKVPQGLFRLHYTGLLGVITALIPGQPRLATWVGRSIGVAGWLRRGATLWLDVIHFTTPSGLRLSGFPGTAVLLGSGVLFLWGYNCFLHL